MVSTASPGWKRVTSIPVAMTVPAPSEPGTVFFTRFLALNPVPLCVESAPERHVSIEGMILVELSRLGSSKTRSEISPIHHATQALEWELLDEAQAHQIQAVRGQLPSFWWYLDTS